MMNQGRAETVGKTRDLLKTVRVKAPVPASTESVLHVEDCKAKLFTVNTGASVVQYTIPE